MSDIARASTVVLRRKLRGLRSLMPDPKGSVATYEFADFLAEQLKGDYVTPEMFLLMIDLAFSDLNRGVDIFGYPIIHRAVLSTPADEGLIRMDILRALDIIFPVDCAEEIKTAMAAAVENRGSAKMGY